MSIILNNLFAVTIFNENVVAFLRPVTIWPFLLFCKELVNHPFGNAGEAVVVFISARLFDFVFFDAVKIVYGAI